MEARSTVTSEHHRRRGLAGAIACLLLAACSGNPPPETPPDPDPEPPHTEPYQRAYVGLFRSAEVPTVEVRDLDEAGFRSALRSRARLGFRLDDFESYLDVPSGERRFAGLWKQQRTTDERWEAADCADFGGLAEERSAEGLALEDFERWSEDGREVCGGLWHGGSRRQVLELDLPCERLEARRAELAADGLRMTDLEVWHHGDRDHCAGVWHPGDGDEAVLVGLELTKLESYVADYLEQGRVLDDVEMHYVGKKLLFSALWHGSGDSYWMWVGTDRPCLDDRAEHLAEGMAAGGTVAECHKETGNRPIATHAPDGTPKPHLPGILEPGEVADTDLPPLYYADLELDDPPAGHTHVARSEAGAGLNASIHLGVSHDGGSSGPGG